MKNKFITFLFILLCMGFGINEIQAADTIIVGNGISISIKSDFTDYSGAPYFASGSSDRNFVVGIRFSLVTADGTTVTSKDYFFEAATNMYVLPGACNKLMYKKVQPCITYSSYWGEDKNWPYWSKISSYSSVSELENVFASHGLNLRVSSGILNGNLGRNYIFNDLFAGTPEANMPKIKNAINQLLSGTGKTLDNDFKLENNKYNLFIEWEPIGRIAVRDSNEGLHYFYGTTYELSNFVNTIKGFNVGTTSSCNGHQYGAYCNFGRAVGKSLSCAVFLDSSSSMGQIVRENIGDNLANNFTPSSYFNGGLLLDTWSGSNCSGDSYMHLFTTTSSSYSGGGVGVIWIGEFGSGIVSDNPSCYDIYDYYGGQFSSQSPYTVLYVNGNNSFNFSDFNNYWKTINSNFTGVDINWFKSNCPGPEDTRYNCTPNYNIPSCTSGDNQNLIYSDTGESGKDETYWQKCIFNDEGRYDISNHKTSAHTSGGPTYYDPVLSSKYCEVYCVEDVIGNLAANNPVVLAGSHFVWGASSINTVRTCRTKNDSINWGTSSTAGSFYYDLNVANQAVANALAWNQLKEVNNGGSWFATGNACYAPSTTKTGDITCTDRTKDGVNIEYEGSCGQQYWDNKSKYINCRNITPISVGPQTWDGTYYNNKYSAVCDEIIAGAKTGDEYEYKINETTPAKTSITLNNISNSGYTGKAEVSSSIFKKCATSQPTGNPVSGGNVSDAISKVDSVINEMNKCFDFSNSGVLNVDTKAHIYYKNEDGIYNYDGPMKVNTVPTYSDNSCKTEISVTALDSCSGTSCSDTTASVKECDTNVKTGSAMTTLSLEDDVYRFVIKNPDGKTLISIHGKELDGYKKNTLKYNWIDIGYSNFPVPYNYSKTEGSLEIKYSNIGHSVDDSSDVDTILKSQTGYGTFGGWSCKYTIEPDLIPDCPDCLGINVIYREIDLARPFPDIDASNRDTGANWCDSESCAWNNYVSSTYILNNRGVVGNAVYDKDPMYTFIMTPSDIIKIRKYNDDNEYSAYNGSDGTKTYNFKCSVGTGRGCRSEYLTELMSMLDTANYPGSCKNERGVVDNDTEFNKCRY